MNKNTLQIKSITRDSIPAALQKAQQYRALGLGAEAESICLDILACDESNDEAIVLLLLALTDQFEKGPADLAQRANALLPKLKNQYEQFYYEGIICERRCKALIHQSGLRSRHHAYEFLQRAMYCYEQAEAIRPKGNDESILRWNACVRILQRYPYLEPNENNDDLGVE